MQPRAMKRLIPRPIKVAIRSFMESLPVGIEVRRRAPKWAAARDRLSYQTPSGFLKIEPTEQVLDVGGGGHPFNRASLVVNYSLVSHSNVRYESTVTPMVLADVHRLPFRDNSFDFVYCSHVLEHVDSPIDACAELMRVGKRGFVETPSISKDLLFAWARGLHKWHVVRSGGSLCFFEYTERQMDGIGSSAWKDVVFGKWHNSLQEAFWESQDLFNILFGWEERFSVFVFHLDGTVDALNSTVNYPMEIAPIQSDRPVSTE